MFLRRLHLSNFRNYDTLVFEPQNGLNILFGKNAQGKSGILESIYFLATSKSHRTSRDQDMIRVESDFLRAEAHVSRIYRPDTVVEVAMEKTGRKIYKIDESKQSRLADILGQFNAVIFSSTDIDMVRGEPSGRRRFLNLEIAQNSPQYAYSLAGYKKVLLQRNNLLKDIKNGSSSASDIHIWNSQLAAFGASVITRRRSFLSSLAMYSSEIYSGLAGTSESFCLRYKSNPSVQDGANEHEIAASLLESFNSRIDQDIARGTTTSGPQRDDFIIEINHLSARDFASQGQQRSAAIAVRLAQMRIYQETSGESPVVLLDDVLAELDVTRRNALMSMLSEGCQTIITTTDLEEIPPHILELSSVYEINAGAISRRADSNAQ